MNEKVFLHYTQAELDRNYDQRGWCPDSAQCLARYPRESEAFRSSTPCRTISYGEADDEKLDIFSVSESDAPSANFHSWGSLAKFQQGRFLLRGAAVCE